MPTPTTTTHKASSSSADKQKHQVKQPPRTPQEFQFAHRTLRKLVQDSTFFPDAAQRDDWFRPRRIGGLTRLQHRGSGSSSSSNNNKVSATTRLGCQHDDDDDDELSSCGHDNQHQQQQRQRQQRIRDRKTPLFIDYCRRKSLEDQFNSSQLTTGSCSSNSFTYYHYNHHHRGSSGGAGGGGGGGGSSSIISCSASHSSKSYCSTSVVAEVITTTANSTITAAATTTTAALSELDKSCASSPISVCSVGATAATAAELPFRRSNHSSNHSSSGSVGSRQQQQQQQQQQERITTLSRRPSFHGGVSVSPHHQLVVVEQQQTCCNDATAAQSTITTTASTTTAAAKRIKKHSVHSIHERELEFGKILGSGGFGQVRLARIRNCTTTPTSSSSSTATESSNAKEEEAAASNNSSSNKSNQYYAMKYLSPHKTSPPPTNNTEEKQPTTTTTKPTISKFERGIADLAMEARFLSLLSHENIVTLWFVSEGSLEEVFNCGTSGNGGGGSSSSVGSVEGRRGSGGSGRSGTTTRRRRSLKHNDSNGREGYHHYRQHGYFLLLDALHETLHQRIQNLYIPEVIDTPLRIYYETEANNNKKYRSNERVAKIQLARRLESLKSIASALQYLHEDCNLIYRDIKPGNIGFYRRYNNDGSSCVCGHNAESNDGCCTCNYTDIPKLFDFGLAKELKSKYRKAHPAHSHDDPPTFKLTSATGSRRYMSPEVALREPYNHKADVYSFGMVLYQISALVVPFDGLEVKSREREVMREGVRPDVTIPSKNSSVRRTRDLRRHYMKETDREKKNMMLSKRARCVWPGGLNVLISECWDHDMRKRPEMREVVERLDACIEELNQR